MSGASAIFKIGDLLNNTYRIEAVLGRGGTSEVYRARSEISGQTLALKALRSEFSTNEDFINLMTREEAIREIRHDAIVRYFHNQKTATGIVFLLMDYVEGPGLDRKLRDGGMEAGELLVVARRVAEGLAAAHSRNITHRDLSPDNIILRGGDPADAVIIDFGIAKDSNPGAETIVGNEFAGKYAYAAPEQLSGQADARSDIYSLGALLLATFRGKRPDVGANPIEVIAQKDRPLDTSGVPEPLKSLIDRMTVPERDARLQSARDVLAMIDAGDAVDEEATVIAPLTRSASPGTAPAAKRPADAVPKKSAVPLVATLGVVLVALAAAAAYLTGMLDDALGPRLPVADPYLLTVSRGSDGAVATGAVPDETLRDTLAARMDAVGGDLDLRLATGEIAEGWAAGVAALLDMVEPLDEYTLSLDGNAARVTGLTEQRALYDELNAALSAPGVVPALSVDSEIEFGPRILPLERVRAVLDETADCGELALFGAPPTGYGPETTVTVAGRVATEQTRANLEDRLRYISGTRPVNVDVGVLNPTLCTIDAVLPRAPAAGFDIAFSDGATGSAVPSGRFAVGDNPVIDVTIPADVTDGHLLVSALDVSGNVFHLLPNVNRPDNSVAELRGGEGGAVTLRVAYPLADSVASQGRKLAFDVDDTSLGMTKVLVIHTSEPILDGLRPTTESAEAFAEAIAARTGPVQSLDSRILTTVAQ